MVGIKLTRAKTGRVSEWNTDDLDDPVNQVHLLHDWLDRSEHTRTSTPVVELRTLETVAHRAVEGLREELARAPKVRLVGVLYRGINLPRQSPPTNFGPPPRQLRNRFNSAGEIALYTSRTSATVDAEISQRGPIPGYWLERFEYTGNLELISLGNEATAQLPRLNQLAILAERAESAEPLDTYVTTIRLRRLCDELGISCVEHPTVTGAYATDASSSNVVTFGRSSVAEVLATASGSPSYVTVSGS